MTDLSRRWRCVVVQEDQSFAERFSVRSSPPTQTTAFSNQSLRCVRGLFRSYRLNESFLVQFRAVLVGLLIGCLLCFTNLYFGLQTGWISMCVSVFWLAWSILKAICRMSLQSALLGYLISLTFGRRMTPQENVVLQTTATATGTVRQPFAVP